MLAWSLLLVCGLRLHRWSDRPVVGMAVAACARQGGAARRRRRDCARAAQGGFRRPDRAAQLRGLASVLADYDGPAELERGLDILLAGLTTTLTPQAKYGRGQVSSVRASWRAESMAGWWSLSSTVSTT